MTALHPSTAQTQPPNLILLTASGSSLHHSGSGLEAGASADGFCSLATEPGWTMLANQPVRWACWCCFPASFSKCSLLPPMI